MPKFSINVLCADSEQTCTHVKKNLMKGYTIKNAKDTDDFDHRGIKEFPTIFDASDEALRLKSISNGKILDVSVSPA